MIEGVDPIQTTENIKSIQKSKNGQAPSPREMPNKIFTKTEPRIIEIYIKVLQSIVHSGDITEQ